MVTTYQDYEQAKEAIIASLSAAERATYIDLKSRLKARYEIVSTKSREVRTDKVLYESALQDYNNLYTQVYLFEKKIGLIEVAKAFAKEMAAKHFKRDIFKMPDEKTL